MALRYLTTVDSPLGKLTLASDGEHLTGLWMEGQKYYGGTLKHETEEREVPVFDLTRAWLEKYFAHADPGPMPPLAPEGGGFRQAVWQRLLAIPMGQTTTYGQITQELVAQGRRAAAQAVGGAVGHNPISILIPCHRVVGATGSLTGYAGGISKKLWLLEHEGVDVSRFFVPKKGTAL